VEGTDPNELLELAIEAACAAGVLLAERFKAGGEHDVSSKSTPTDLVSEADVASQRAIRELIGARRPEDGFLAEEEGTDSAGSSSLQWVVDPLDGTINFLFGIPLWCVSVAVRDAHGTLAGVVHDPLAGETFNATVARSMRPARAPRRWPKRSSRPASPTTRVCARSRPAPSLA
jgi:myo-inositol-1(or 4)-monophosphatase